MVFLLHVSRLPLVISRFVSRNRILCEATFRLLAAASSLRKAVSIHPPHGNQGIRGFRRLIIPTTTHEGNLELFLLIGFNYKSNRTAFWYSLELVL